MRHLRSRKNAGCALGLMALAGLFAASANAQAVSQKKDSKDSDQVQKLEKFEVTGSRIKRIDAETVSPVVSISASQIEVQGFNTLGEALQSIPMNSGQSLTPTDSGTSFTPGVATVNLRGLGNNNTLVLVNGRRSVPYASPGFSGFQTMFDFNSIPASAIDKIEILKDGASALYGSDAVSGVLDIKLRRDFEGLTTSASVGNFLNTDALRKRASVVLGTHNAKTSITMAFDWVEQNATFARDLSFTANADKGTDGTALQASPHYIAEGWNLVTTDKFTSEADYIKNTIGTNVLDPAYGWFDARSNTGYPGYVVVGGKTRTFTNPTNTPTVATSASGRNKYNYQEVNGLDPKIRRYSMYSIARHDFNPNIYMFSEVSFTRSESESHSASAPASLASEQGLSAGTKMFIPSYNPYNPWAVDITSGARRLVEAGNRINDVTADTPRILLGLGGTIPNAGLLEDWTWEIGAMYTKSTVNTINRNSVPDYRLQQALMGLTRLGDGTLVWNPNTAQDKRVYFNWFGLNEKAFGDFLAVKNPNSNTLEYKQFDFKASGTVYQLPAGKMGLAVGAEHRFERMEKVVSDLNATSNIIGGSAGTGFYGTRKVTSLYSELDVPVIKGKPFAESVEVQFAARFEDYSDDGFAKQARPKIGIKYKPFDWMIVRGSFSRCFKAPDLAFLYTASQTTFTSGQVYDPATKTTLTQLQVNVAGNTKLAPELTDVAYFGVAFEPKGKLKGLQFSIDGFRYQQTNLLTQLSDLYGYADFLSEAYKGNPLFSDKVVRNTTTNEVLYIRDDYANISHGEYKGVDAEVAYQLKTKNLGLFNFSMMGTWIHYVAFDSANMAGSWLIPKWKGSANVAWTKGDWSANVFANYYGKRTRTYSLGSWYDEGDEIALRYTMDPRVVVNASVSYSGIPKTKISLGVSNLFNTAPAMDPMNQDGATTGVGYFNPAFVSLRVERKF